MLPTIPELLAPLFVSAIVGFILQKVGWAGGAKFMYGLAAFMLFGIIINLFI